MTREPARDAIDQRIDQLCSDKDFQERLRRAVERNSEALESHRLQ